MTNFNIRLCSFRPRQVKWNCMYWYFFFFFFLGGGGGGIPEHWIYVNIEKLLLKANSLSHESLCIQLLSWNRNFLFWNTFWVDVTILLKFKALNFVKVLMIYRYNFVTIVSSRRHHFKNSLEKVVLKKLNLFNNT